ncbi:hypothetical protein HK101_001556 [Irineochytrium annulatum]|nr:hypothetical protein HK101_001556 [Irineochytrium annulatum]
MFCGVKNAATSPAAMETHDPHEAEHLLPTSARTAAEPAVDGPVAFRISRQIHAVLVAVSVIQVSSQLARFLLVPGTAWPAVVLAAAWCGSLVVLIGTGNGLVIPTLHARWSLLTAFYGLSTAACVWDAFTPAGGDTNLPLVKLATSALSLIAALLAAYQLALVEDERERKIEDSYKIGGGMAPCREATTGIFGWLTFSWMNPLMRLGWQRPLTMEDIPDLREEDRAENISARFAATTDRSMNLFLQLLNFERVPLFCMMLAELVNAGLMIFSPYCLYLIIGYITEPAGRPASYAFYVAAALGSSIMIKGFIENQVFQQTKRMEIRLKTILVDGIFRKSLHRASSIENRQKASEEDGAKGDIREEKEEEGDESASVGKIVTLMSSDAEKIKDTIPLLIDLVTFAFAITVSMTGLFFVVGWSAFAGLSIMIATMPLTYFMASYTDEVVDTLMAATDKRTDIINEALQGIRIIKYFSWEINFLKKIDEARAREIRSLVQYYVQDGILTLLWVMTPILVSFFTLFSVTKIEGKNLDPQMAFTCISLFNAIRMPLSLLPETIVQVFQLNVSVKRIAKFLAQPDLERFTAADYYRTQGPNDPIMGFRSAWFQWYTREAMNQETDTPSPADQPTATVGSKTMPDETRPLLSAPSIASTTDATTLAAPRERDSTTDGSTFTLRGIDLTFPVGGLTAVCGPTGAGKSSIMQALLGEMKRISGRAFLPDPRRAVATGLGDLTTGVAYVAQTSWLQNATIKDNICFGEAYDAIRYDRVIRACALVKDLETLEAGDLTEIGEKGINLSGGQKQRISLARAAYSRASFILLDDPLSAVDPPTARHLLTQCIIGLLGDRTRVLVTHATSLVLPHADRLVVIREGEVLASGSVAEVLAGSPAAAALVEVQADDLTKDGAIERVGSMASMMDDTEDLGMKDYANGRTEEDAKKLVEKEETQTGAITVAVYWSYVSAGGGFVFLIPLMLSFASDRSVLAYSDYWIKCWAEAYNASGDGNATKLDTFAVFSSLPVLSVAEGKPLITRVMADDNDGSKVDAMYYASIYALISLGWAATFFISFLIRSVAAYLASQKYHGQLMKSIFYAPMRFFDTTPIGRILNRASKDISVIDKDVMPSFAIFLSCINDAFSVIVLITLITPIFVFAILPIAVVYIAVAVRYLAVSRELKRLDSTTRSPIYSMFSESLT